MKSKTSFLFFYAVFIATIISNVLHSQEVADSSRHFYNLILKPRANNDLVNAYVFFEKHKKQSLKNNDTLRAILDLRYIAEAQNKLGSLYDSESSTVKAMSYLDGLKGTDTIIEPRIGIYNQLGMIYRQFEDYNKSLEYYDKVLGITSDSSHIAQINNNKASVYKDLKRYELAIAEYNKAYKFYIGQEKTLEAARALDNIGNVQSIVKDSMALVNLERALVMKEKINHVSGIYTSYLHLAEYYKNKDNIKALLYAEKSLLIANSSSNIKYKENALSMIFSLKKDPRVVEYMEIIDSINKEKQIQENKYAASKYEYSQYLKKAQESELQKEKEKRLKIIYKFIGMFIVLLAISLYIILRIRHKKEKVQQVYNTEIRISKKVHDEVANDLYHVMTKLQTKNDSHEDVLDDLEGIYNKTRDISKENSTIDVNENYKDLLNDLLLSYKNNDINVVTKNITKVDWEPLSDLKKTTLYRVLQELMTNMRKHSKASIVLISFNQTKNKIVIDYKDNGIGCDLVKNNGLLNAENRMTSINGTITFESQTNNSFKAKITV